MMSCRRCLWFSLASLSWLPSVCSVRLSSLASPSSLSLTSLPASMTPSVAFFHIKSYSSLSLFSCALDCSFLMVYLLVSSYSCFFRRLHLFCLQSGQPVVVVSLISSDPALPVLRLSVALPPLTTLSALPDPCSACSLLSLLCLLARPLSLCCLVRTF